MKFRACLVALMLLVAGTTFAPVAPSRAQSEYDFSQVDALLLDALPKIGGGCGLLILQNGKVVYKKAFGTYTVNQVVPIASATKWLSGAVIMALVDEGKIKLDDPASKYLPNFVGLKGRVTIRQMFSHTSGLPSNSLCTFNRDTTLATCVDEIARLPLTAEPGTQFAYGNASMHVAGRIAEIVTMKSWDQVFKEKIGDPLGLKNTDYEGLGNTDNPLIAGGAQSSLDDYGRFLQMLLNRGSIDGKRILSEQAVTEMFKDQTNGVPIAYTPYQNYAYLSPELPQTRYGIGHWLEVLDKRTGQAVEHGSQGAFGFSPWLDLNRNLVGVLLVKDELNNVMPVYFELRKLVRQIIPEGPSSGDVTKPTVTQVKTSKNKIIRRKDPTVEITWTSSDDRGVVSHDILHATDGQTFSVQIAAGLSGAAQGFVWTISSEIEKTKRGVVKVVARDAAGNVGEGVSEGVLIVK